MEKASGSNDVAIQNHGAGQSASLVLCSPADAVQRLTSKASLGIFNNVRDHPLTSVRFMRHCQRRRVPDRLLCDELRTDLIEGLQLRIPALWSTRPWWLRFATLLGTVAFGSSVCAAGIDIVREKTTRFEQLSSRYAAAALRVSKNSRLLLSYKNVDTKEQSCMVLIDLLGLHPEDSAQSVHPDPGLDSEDPNELARYSLSLTSYVNAARSLLQENEFSWRYKWNLNCSGVFGADRYMKITENPPYSVTMLRDKETLRIVGDVDEGLLDSVAKRLAIHRSIKRVELASSGGLTYEALKIGRVLRKRNITTIVASNCLSSCALIFLGGSQRIVPQPYWELGFHRVSRRGTPVWDGDEVYDKIREYIDEMIGSGDELVEKSLIPTGLDFYRPSRNELCSWSVATSVVDVCDAMPEP
jgi:hypothetical protein